MNVAYKHLDSKLRIADLTIGQWIGVIAGAALGVTWGLYVSPFGPTLTLTSAIYLAGLPIGAALCASITDFDPWLMLRSAVAWRRRDARFTPGAGASAAGYSVAQDAEVAANRAASGAVAQLDPGSLWEDAR
jgi:hypothetical protein